MLTLDMDHGTPDILDELSLLNSHELCVYSTHKHTPEAPRLRLIFPLKGMCPKRNTRPLPARWRRRSGWTCLMIPRTSRTG